MKLPSAFEEKFLDLPLERLLPTRSLGQLALSLPGRPWHPVDQRNATAYFRFR